jgi:hypothetical protein
VILEHAGRLLKANLPAALRRRPSARAFVLTNLMLQRRRDYEDGNAFHAIRLVETSVDLVQAVIRLLDFRVGDRAACTHGEDLLFEVHEGQRVCLALQRRPRHEVAVDVGQHGVNAHEVFGRFVSATSATDHLRPCPLRLTGGTNPATQMVEEHEDGLCNTSVSGRMYVEARSCTWELSIFFSGVESLSALT